MMRAAGGPPTLRRPYVVDLFWWLPKEKGDDMDWVDATSLSACCREMETPKDL